MILIAFMSIIQSGARINERRQSEEFAIRAINASMTEADQAIDELNKLARNIFDEIEEKHQELLFLYSMLESHKKDDTVSEHKESPPKKETYKNPKLGKIRSLFDQGMSEDEIAKTLGIGQGEVKLILSLGRER
ncbi:MAG: hypothetical protein LBQ68_00905 [Clostridiales bacterium]|nr:hypothetical protein [Clostridiales bacterium]